MDSQFIEELRSIIREIINSIKKEDITQSINQRIKEEMSGLRGQLPRPKGRSLS